MDNPANWNPSTVPGSGDNAIFNSAIPGIATNPTESSAPFSVSTFNFPSNASLFNFNFNNQTLTFNGVGITGSNKNPFITVNNTNNTSFSGDLISFLGGIGTSGSSVITTSNNATLTGNQTGFNIGFMGSNFLSAGAFTMANGGSITASNTGVDNTVGGGSNIIAQLNTAQILMQSTGTVGDNCTFNVSNTGIDSSQATTSSSFVGYLNDQQFFVGSSFQAGNNFSLIASNIGTDTSNGYGGNLVAVINSNSGTTGDQILFQQGFTLGNHATIKAINSGTSSGTNTNGGSNVGGMNLGQIAIGDRTSVGSYSLNAGDNFSLSASNSGIDSGNGTGTDAVGSVSIDQIAIFAPVVLGDNANITITKSGNFSGNASLTYVNVGSAGGSQLNCASSFTVGENFTLNVNNSGTNTGTGIGGYFIGDIITGQQVVFQDGVTIRKNASVSISNSGSNSSNTTANNQVGSCMGYGKQLLAKELFRVEDDFKLEITNSGFDDSTGAGGNFVGFFNNNTVDNTASQVHFAGFCLVSDRASITISNTGHYQGSNTTSGNIVGVLAGQQFNAAGAFQAGNDFELRVSNSGFDNASAQNNNSIGVVNSSQAIFGGSCNLGNNATMVFSNIGTNNDVTGYSNNIGVVNGSQMLMNGSFTAGADLNITATNMSVNDIAPSNVVGNVTDSQLSFTQSCTLNDGSTISAFNSGVVLNSQIVFAQGFNVASGSVTIKATNQAVVGSFGIDVQGNNAGGNANIVLEGTVLNIGTTLSNFTIAGIEGDSSSIVQSQPQLIINTAASTNAEFAGMILNFPAISSTLMKTGPGTQKLSGINTYSGLTTVQEGTLVVNGSLAGDVLVNPLGTLKGNGSIGGTLTNTGVVSPGNSIGVLTVGNYINNNGTYDVEVNGLGQSDLIDASGTATLNGGTVVVSSVDGTFSFQQPYTIVTADGGVTGTFNNATSLAFITPTLSYDLNNVYLTLHSALLRAAEKCNQFGVASALDSIVGPNTSQSLLISAIASSSLETAQDALESLSGYQYTNDVLVTNISASRFLRRLYDPLRPLVTSCDRCYPCVSCNEWTTWLETGYSYTNIHGNTAHNLNFDSYQITGGIQKTFCEDLTFGLAGSYEYDSIKYRNGKANRNSAFASIYGLYRPNAFYGLFDLAYGCASNRLKRSIEVGNLKYKASSKPNFNIFTFYGEAGFDLNTDCVLIQPFLGIQVGKNWRGHINENHSSGWGLKINKRDWSTTSSRLGLHLTACKLYECIDASFDIAWNQLLSSRKNSAEGRFKEFGNDFSICGNQLDNYSIDYALTFTTTLCKGLKGYVEVDGEWWKHADTTNILGGIVYSW